MNFLKKDRPVDRSIEGRSTEASIEFIYQSQKN